MKQISVLMARTVWSFDLAQLNPKGLNVWPALEWLIKKYQFASFPKNVLDLNNEKALAFQAGTFINSKKQNVLIALSVYNNGLIADASSSTDDSDEFLQDVAAELSKTFELNIPSKVGRGYVSQLEVESQFSLTAVNPKLDALAELMSASVETVDAKPRTYDFGVLQFWTEDTNPLTSPAYFRFERKAGLPPSNNRYFSQAALRTEEHLEFLEKFEAAFRPTDSV